MFQGTEDLAYAPQAAQALAELRKESLDIYNRIHSIVEDVAFVDAIADQYKDLPVVRE